MSCLTQIRTRIFKGKNESRVKKRWKKYARTYLKESIFRGQDVLDVSDTAAAFDKIIGVHMPSQFYTEHVFLRDLISSQRGAVLFLGSYISGYFPSIH